MSTHLLPTILCLACATLPAQVPSFLAGWYTGFELCQSELRIPGRSVDLDGIHFSNVTAEGSQAGAKHLRLEGESLKMDITDAKVVSLGLTYRL